MASNLCIKQFMDIKKMDLNDYVIDNNINIKMYNSGQAMGPHYDGQDGHTKLQYSLVLYLNNDYEGGEIYFKNQNISLKPTAGSLILFPSQQPFEHESKMIISGYKYMVPSHIYAK
jgi:predicted 2-oxoglutarate/Fe(II)-dependent dioxygenase YbiX